MKELTMTDFAAWWPVGAVVFSVFGALIVGFNQWANLPGVQLVRWRCLGVWPLALLGAWLLPWPTAWGFYATAVAMGMGLAVADVALFNASRVHGARLAAVLAKRVARTKARPKPSTTCGLALMMEPMAT
jgi:hypothetical protein